MTALLLGLDVGSTVVKAVLYDVRGRTLAAESRTLPVSRPRPGWVERDASLIAREAMAVVRQASRGAAKRIVAVGVTGCGNGAVFLDRKQAPVRAGILSSDTRAEAWLKGLRPKAHQAAYPGQMPFLLSWVRRHEPAVFRRVAHVVFWKDYVRALLTGEIATDPTDAGAAGLLAYPSRRLISRDPLLPELRESLAFGGAVTSAAARATGLRVGTPVVTGCIDCEAAALGSGVLLPGDLSLVAGTWSINQAFALRPPQRSGHFLVNPSVVPGRWLVLEGSPASAANFDWAIRVFGPDLDAGRGTAEASHAGASRPYFLPQVATGQGVFAKLDAAQGRAEMLAAVMEGIVFAHRAHISRLLPRGSRPRRATLVGGVARNPAWCQLFADGLGCPVDVPLGQEHGALGAALCAGVAHGLWPSLREAQAALVPAARRYRPAPGRARELSDRYRIHRQLVSSFPS